MNSSVLAAGTAPDAQPTNPAARSPRVLRSINAGVVLRAIRLHEPVSRAEVARKTGLSRPTVNEVVQQLIDVGYVEQTQVEQGVGQPRRPGRPPVQLLRFRADAGYVLGLEIGGTKVRAVLSDLNGTILARERRVPQVGDPKATLAAIRRTARSVLRKAGVALESVRGVGAATPGVIDPETGCVYLAPQVSGWEGTHLLDELQGWFDCPVVVEGEVRAALIGESTSGLAQGYKDVAYLYLGTGVGAAIMIGGQVYRGQHGTAGEIGFLPVCPRVPADAPPGFGVFEYAVGGTAFARLGRSIADRPGEGDALRRMAGESGEVGARVVFRAAAEGDPAALRIVDTISRDIARGVASVALVLDPQLIVLGGGLAQAGAPLLDRIVVALRDLVPRQPRVVLSGLGVDGVVLGALRLGLDVAEQQLFDFAQRPLGGRPQFARG